MVQGLKIQVHFKIDLISAPGTLISENHGDVFISVKLFNTNFRRGLFHAIHIGEVANVNSGRMRI